MNTRNFIKKLSLSPLIFLPFQFKQKPKELVFEKLEIKNFKFLEPYKTEIQTIFGNCETNHYTLCCEVTKNILVRLYDGTYYTNTFREYARIVAKCHTNNVCQRYKSQVFKYDEITYPMLCNFLVKVKSHFERGLYPDYGWHIPFNRDLNKIEVQIC